MFNNHGWIGLHEWIGLLVVLALLVLLRGAFGHDAARPDLNGWFNGLQSGKGPCCDGHDAKRLDNADWESRDGHYRVRIDDEWIDVPNEAVVPGPNLAGHTMVWPVYVNGHPTVRCFIPGSMT